MKYVDGYRDADAAAHLRRDLVGLGEALQAQGRRTRIMEVCGTHTMAIARYGVRDFLPPAVELVSGPGCPVCVTDAGYIDAAIDLAEHGVVVVTFGDMLRVPGTDSSLERARAGGGQVEVCYSPAQAIAVAKDRPGAEVVFLAIGFETTVAPVVAMLAAAERQGIANLSLLTAFKRVPPALSALTADPELELDAFLCPAHVSAIIGADAYRTMAKARHIPCVIAGFEPLDILYGLQGILSQLLAGYAEVENQYDRVVRPCGNRKAQALIHHYLEPVDATWRGLGTIPGSGSRLRPVYARYDAEARYQISIRPTPAPPGCLCGDVLTGKVKPPDCALFATACTPAQPVGPCMVSSEGSCAAAYRYGRH